MNNREILFPRGKGLGGSSSINGHLYVRGQQDDYNQWAQLGNIGWGEYRSFTEASKFAKSLKFESLREWKQYSPSGQRPEDIPSHPETIYKDQGWSGWPDFLGYEPKKKKK